MEKETSGRVVSKIKRVFEGDECCWRGMIIFYSVAEEHGVHTVEFLGSKDMCRLADKNPMTKGRHDDCIYNARRKHFDSFLLGGLARIRDELERQGKRVEIGRELRKLIAEIWK